MAEKKARQPGKFTILVAAGKDSDGADTYKVVGEAEGTSKKNAITKATQDGGVSLSIGDVVVAVSSKQFVPKPIALSI
jgi:hypothetical protein